MVPFRFLSPVTTASGNSAAMAVGLGSTVGVV